MKIKNLWCILDIDVYNNEHIIDVCDTRQEARKMSNKIYIPITKIQIVKFVREN